MARRLVAERSSEAAAALAQVIRLDPQGPRADDALLDQALLEGPPRWPEDLGAIDEAAARRTLALLERVSEEFPTADRAGEARYRGALLRLEPLRIRDASAAQLALVQAATDPAVSEWTLAARYTIAWLAAHEGYVDRAAAAFGRLLVEARDGEAAARAAAGLARLEMRRGDPGWAATLLDRALAAEVGPRVYAEGLRELAVRLVLFRQGVGRALTATRVVGLSDGRLGTIVATSDGLLFADDRRGVVLELSGSGRTGGEWPLSQVEALATDAVGRHFAATAESVVRLVEGRPPIEIARLDGFGPPQTLVAEATGRLLLLDRKGASIVAIEPGATAPKPFWSTDGARLSLLVGDGGRLLAYDARSKDVVVVEPGGRTRGIGLTDLTKPAALAVDAAGRLAVLDAKDDTIHVLAGDGERVQFPCKPAGIGKPTLAGYTIDGTLQVVDLSSGQWYRVQ